MKYSESSPPLACMQTQSTCYRGTRTMEVKGVLWHSTGSDNPNLKRYVQPSDGATDRAAMLALLGVNANGNDWNHIERQAGLNAWIGRLADGSVAAVQTMPWNYRPWGCGSGSKGSCNDGWIQFEICEDDLTGADYFGKVYREACELTAYLCKKYGIDPHGTVPMGGVRVPTILCHNDSYKLGFGSGHADVRHWFPKFGKSMETARDDVAALLAGETEKEDDEMDKERFKELWLEMRTDLQDNEAGAWSQEARDWAVGNGLIQGGSGGELNGMWEDLLTREQLVTVLYRFAKMMGKA